jgi:hypothetical protein
MSPTQAVLTHSAVPFASLTCLGVNSGATLTRLPPFKGELDTIAEAHSISNNTKITIL